VRSAHRRSTMGDFKDLEEIAKTATDDFYALLGVTTFDVEDSEIKRAYRKASVKVHPDKNPDDADAADKFIRLGIARDILLDAKLKTEYDRQRQRKREKALQDELLDGKRRRMKEDLERREREGFSNLKRKQPHEMGEAEKREMDIQRLAEDGKRRRMEYQEKLAKQRQEEEAIDRTIRVRFVREAGLASWDKDRISSMFARYGATETIVMGKDKKLRIPGEKHKKTTATVLIVYTRLEYAQAAVVGGKVDWPMLESVGWASKEPEIKSPMNASAPSTPVATPNKNFRASFGPGTGLPGSTFGTPKFSFSPKTPSSEEETMKLLKQAEKRRLEQIRRQEAADAGT
jgi:DnaJ family protein C protein 17